MKNFLLTCLANITWFISSAIYSRPWKRAITNVQATQTELLLKLVKKNTTSLFGQNYNFTDIKSIQDFQQKVPISSYEDLLPWIERIKAGERMVLTSEIINHFALSSGSTAASKFLPYTNSLVQEFQGGINPWVYYLISRHPKLITGKAYWSVTPVGETLAKTAGGIPIGFDDERSYFSPFEQFILESIVAVPAELQKISDMNHFRYATLRFLLQEKGLAWVSIWNPSFLLLLLEDLKNLLPGLAKDIRHGSLSIDIQNDVFERIKHRLRKDFKRAREIENLIAAELTYEELCQKLWPNLYLISCWADAHAAEEVPHLKRIFPRTIIQPKGLIATEAMVSFPISEDETALSITSHFFEFEETNSKEIVLAHQLKKGVRYAVIITTGGGLYRYRLNDVVEITGFIKQCPLLKFIGKQDKVIDLRGEKLNEQFVRDTVSELLNSLNLKPSFWMVAPEKNGQEVFYVLFIRDNKLTEQKAKILALNLDNCLRQNYHFDYCRRLEQIKFCRIFTITSNRPADIYLKECTNQGQRLGDIKPVALHGFTGWSDKFIGSFVN